MNAVIKYASQAGLKKNVSKTKLLRVNATTACSLMVDGEKIEEVESFCYLGSYITRDGGAEKDAEHRIIKTSKAFGAMHKIWRSNKISTNLKIKFFKTNVLSVLLYGCETWKVTDKIISSVEVFVNKCLRQLLKIFWPIVITNKELLTRTKMENFQIMIKRRKWNWIGHTIRRPSKTDIAKAALEWNPQGKRKRGRPKATWRRTIIEEAKEKNKCWGEIKNLAKNRVRWRGFVDELCDLAALQL